MTTPVIFREYRGGDIIAVFPTLVANHRSADCQSYMHVGQHGACNYHYGVLPLTRPAEFLAYWDLLTELRQRGYDDPKIYKRWQQRFDKERKQARELYQLSN